eukprot:Nitzschia sp. Nitz4//scaffold136_size62208//4385//8376//NITZ4_006361-RA/size62208-augustus-gene-0.5-mRNA-1//-1//CDS//3329535597//9313//frame0
MEEGSKDDAETSSNKGSSTESTERDEIQEVRNVSKRETFRVFLWRLIATGVLLLTAIAVTLTTYFFLERQQRESFETQVRSSKLQKFLCILMDRTWWTQHAAMTQMERARNAQWAYSRTLSGHVYSSDRLEWPLVQFPLFAMYGNDLMTQGRLELSTPVIRVGHDQREAWEAFVVDVHQDMVEESHLIENGNLDSLIPNATSTFVDFIWKASAEGRVPEDELDEYWVVLDTAPAPRTYGLINLSVGASSAYGPMIDTLLDLKYEALLTSVKPYEAAVGTVFTKEEHEEMHNNLDILDGSSASPHSFWSFPIYENPLDPDSRIVAVNFCPMAWDVFMLGLLPEGVKGITVVLDNSCDQSFTFSLDGPTVYYVGEGDFHDTKYDYLETFQDLMEGSFTHPNYTTSTGHCQYSMRIYASDDFSSSLEERIPVIFAIAVAGFFGMVAAVFFTYDVFVQRRNEALVNNAARSNAIVSSLFPSNIRDRLLNINQQPADIRKKSGALGLKGFMSGEMEAQDDANSKPLADLFLECTVMFADIAGFTAWSSMREPSQVFTILETLYGAFDQIAKTRKVLKVETVGDCYVAASGIPDYRRDHAVVMVRFARDILAKMVSLTKELEVSLGPDTGDLSLRIGVHSGPVTGGVLRGERSRFQLFGDTMNVCSRVESTGTAGRIQLSYECGQQLISNGKEHWLVKREQTVQAKGKGEIQTYWLGMGVCNDERRRASSSVSSGEVHGVYEPVDDNCSAPKLARTCPDAKSARLVDWIVQMLSDILKQIIARRKAKELELAIQRSEAEGNNDKPQRRNSPPEMQVEKNFGFEGCRPLDEVQEIIQLPEFDAAVAKRAQDPSKIEIDEAVMDQLHSLCANISACYNENWFHNFEHASHVTMSVVKLLSRIVAPTETTENEIALHDHTYGITSDPLTQFACAFAAMIHDVNHVGVPNAQLVKEGARIVSVFGDRSVAEQNSVVVAWDLFMSKEYDLLRSTVCANDTELLRFRQLVVNSVMATDIVDKDLKNLRNNRWEKAFNDTEATEDSCRAAVNRKATIVIEHLLQASDVAHTMQHWHVYRKWNERFFRECTTAYLNGRAEKNPVDTWYKGEIGFFDFYIIPLAKKLKECGVFGKSSDEYLTYAKANRDEWERRGEDIVRDMLGAMERELQNSPESLEKLDMLNF